MPSYINSYTKQLVSCMFKRNLVVELVNITIAGGEID